MEGVCLSYHSVMRSKHGWQFCPWCGIELTIKHHCDHCGRDFISEAAYHTHIGGWKLLVKNPCPNEKKGQRTHPVQHLKYRNRMYCPSCRIEYPIKVPKDSKKEGIPIA